MFRWILYKAGISIKRTLLPCTNGVHFIEIPQSFLKDTWLQPKILVLIINFFSLNFTSIEIQEERVNSSQNERTLGEGVGRKRTRAKKGVGGSKLGNLEEAYFLNVPYVGPRQWYGRASLYQTSDLCYVYAVFIYEIELRRFAYVSTFELFCCKKKFLSGWLKQNSSRLLPIADSYFDP